MDLRRAGYDCAAFAPDPERRRIVAAWESEGWAGLLRSAPEAGLAGPAVRYETLWCWALVEHRDGSCRREGLVRHRGVDRYLQTGGGPTPCARTGGRLDAGSAADNNLEDLRHGLQLLSKGPRDLPARQQTLTATLDWSAALLGASRDLRMLVDHSLVTALPEHLVPVPRYRMLEPIRQYAHERLITSADAFSAHEGFVEYYLALSDQAGPALHDPEQGDWCELLAVEHNNLRLAMEWLLENSRSGDVVRIGRNLWLAWMLGGHAHAHELAAALVAQGIVATSAGDPELAEGVLQEAHEILQTEPDAWLLSTVFDGLAHVALSRREFERASVHLATQERLARRAGDWNSLAGGLCTRALCARVMGDEKRAAELFRESVQIATRSSEMNIVLALTGLAGVAIRTGEAERAARLFGGAENLREKLGSDINWPELRQLKHQDIELIHAQIGATGFERAFTEGRPMTPEAIVAFALA
jgi:tetratricopeptide (TPR) repeat protein